MELVIGRVARSHGVRGELAVDVRTDDPARRFVVGGVLRGRRPRADVVADYRVESIREHGARLLLRLAGVDDRAGADAMRGMLFVVEHTELPPSGEDEFYDHELIGLTVLRPDGEQVGTVLDVIHGAAGEWLSVRPGKQDHGERLVPFVAAIVTSVDVVGGAVVIDPPPGLLEG